MRKYISIRGGVIAWVLLAGMVLAVAPRVLVLAQQEAGEMLDDPGSLESVADEAAMLNTGTLGVGETGPDMLDSAATAADASAAAQAGGPVDPGSQAQSPGNRPPAPVALDDPGLFYYGWKGERVPLILSTDHVAVTFRERVTGARAEEILGSDARFEILPFEEYDRKQSLDLGKTVVVATVPGMTMRHVADAIPSVAARLEVERTHPVFRTGIPDDRLDAELEARRRGGESLDPAAIRNDDTRGQKESVLTDYVSVVVDRVTPQADIEAMFAEDNLEIVSRTDYPAIGKVGYRLLVTPATLESARAKNRSVENSLTIANRYYESDRVLEATPAFAPYYNTASSVDVPLVPDNNFPPAGYDGFPKPGWIYTNTSTGVNAQAGWNNAYNNGAAVDWTTVMANTAYDDIVIAALDNGVWADYDTLWKGIYGEANPPPSPGEYLDTNTATPNITDGHPDFWKKDNNDVYIDTLSNIRKLINPKEYYAATPKNDGIDNDGNGYIDDYFGIDFVGNDPTNGAFTYDRIPYSDHYLNPIFNLGEQHGTMFAGVVGARPDNGNAIGVCPTCQVIPVRYRLTTYEQGEVYGNADIFFIGRSEKAINYATNTGAHVAAVMMPIETYDPLIYAAVQNARANGLFVTSTAGNDDESLDARPLFPASWPEVVAVGASGSGKPEEPEVPPTNAPSGRGYFGYKVWCDPNQGYLRPNYGWAVDIVAPSSKFYTDENCASPYQDGYWGSNFADGVPVARPGGGTSNSMPQIAGLAGLILTANPVLSPAEVQFCMQDSATDMDYTDGAEVAGPKRDRYTGHGRYNMGGAIDKANLARKFYFIRDTRRADPDPLVDSPDDSDAITDNDTFRSIMSVDADGDLVIDGRIKEMATNTELADSLLVTELIRFPSGGPYVARLDPRYVINAGDPGSSSTPTLYLAGHFYPKDQNFPSDVPNENLEMYVGAQLVAYIDVLGNLHVKADVFQGAKTDWDLSTGSHIKAVDTTAGSLSGALASAMSGDVLVLSPGTYGPINFAGKQIIIRSTDPYDRRVVASTIIQAGPNQRAVTFGGGETDDAALIGFTIRGNGTSNSGGISGAGTKARILYNVFVTNKRPSTANGGAIDNCDGLIEGNVFGRLGEGNQAGKGGALANCDGVVIKNFFRYNFANYNGGAIYAGKAAVVENLMALNESIDGGAISSLGLSSYSVDEISANLVFGNTATNGGGLYDCDNAAIRHNTIYGNLSDGPGGAIYGTAPESGQFYNCILWGNTPAQLYNSSNPTYSCIQGIAVPNANNNIASNPSFVSSTYVDSVYLYDDFADNNYTGWSVWGGTWSAANGYLSGSGASGATIQRGNVNPNLDLSFRVRREAGANAALVSIRYNSAAPGDSVRLRMLQTKSVLDLRLGGVWTEALTNTDADVLLGNWYDVFVRANGDAIQVWLGRLDAGVGMTKILDYWPDLAAVPPRPVPTLTTSNLVLQADVGTTVWYDNIELDANSNLDTFLKLSGVPGFLSPCIDKGDLNLDTFRDFDDELGPLDGPENPDNDARRGDIGADEYTTLSPMPYWWKNF